MPVPLVGIAVAAAARLAAKKVAQEAAKKTAKAAAAAKTAKIAKNSVKVLPRKTAPKTGLEGRGKKLSPVSKADRAANEYIKKAESRWEGEYLTTQTGLKGPIEKGVRGPSRKKLARETAMLKQANKKQPIKINSNSSSRANRTRSGNKAK
jgi:hypothetical protein